MKNKDGKDSPPTKEGDIYTSKPHLMDYFTVAGVYKRTGYQNKRDWYLLPIKELLDNSIDFLMKYYKDAEGDKATINIDIDMNDKLFHLKIRNSNDRNEQVFPNLKAIFDFDRTYGSKQDVHIISRGMLGDAMKQILSLGYVLVHVNDDGTAFTNEQWTYPLIIRHNKEEWLISVEVNKAAQTAPTDTKLNKQVPYTDTEIELWLPVIDEVRNDLTRDYIEEFCRKYTLFNTGVPFKFTIIDDIHHALVTEAEGEYVDEMNVLVEALSKTPRKGILHIDVPALHPVTTEKAWNNTDTLHSYTPEEFLRRIYNVHEKDSTTVYDILFKFREGSNIPKTPENRISVSQLISSKNKDTILKNLYDQLRDTLEAPKELLLPYNTNAKKRKEMLYSRIVESKFYDIDTEKASETYTERKYSYAFVRGEYEDDTVKYPFAFEIIAVPIKKPEKKRDDGSWIQAKTSQFTGAINYSVSPKANYFEYDEMLEYYYDDGNLDENRKHSVGKNIKDILSLNEFTFDDYLENYSKLPCVIFANLITPKWEPRGEGKTGMKVEPFIDWIKTAVEQMASGIQTYRAVGHNWVRFRSKTRGEYHGGTSKINGTEILRQFLMKERGLPDVTKQGGF